MRNVNILSDEIALQPSVGMLSLLYWLGASVWFPMMGEGLLNTYINMMGILCWGFEIKRLREFIENYPVIGLSRGFWFLRPKKAGLYDNIFVSLRLNSVIIPGLLLLSFRDAKEKTYSYLIVPSMVGGKERFSCLSRYAKLSPVFQ